MLHPLCVVVALIFLSTGSTSSVMSLHQGATDGKKQLSDVLNDFGTDYDKFFTIEDAKSTGKATPLSKRPIARPGKKFGLTRELEELRRTVTGFTYYPDSRNPQVIHIVDAPLVAQKNYGMNLIVKEINFTGPLYRLPDHLKQQGIPVEVSRQYTTTSYMTADFRTQVSVKAKSIRVREALTDLNSLKGRSSRVIWTSETTIGKNEDSVIVFHI